MKVIQLLKKLKEFQNQEEEFIQEQQVFQKL